MLLFGGDICYGCPGASRIGLSRALTLDKEILATGVGDQQQGPQRTWNVSGARGEGAIGTEAVD